MCSFVEYSSNIRRRAIPRLVAFHRPWETCANLERRNTVEQDREANEYYPGEKEYIYIYMVCTYKRGGVEMEEKRGYRRISPLVEVITTRKGGQR